MKRKNLLALILAIVMTALSMLLFVACADDEPDLGQENLKYASFYDRVEKYAYADFLEENITRKPFDQRDLPFDIVKIIRTESELENAIPTGKIEVDFDSEVLVVYFFTDINYGFDCKLQGLKIADNFLTIYILHGKAKEDNQGVTPPSSSMPIQRCLAIKTSLTNFDTATINMSYASF